eukprot:6212757-Pleurochrysis_carterae.AAC.2
MVARQLRVAHHTSDGGEGYQGPGMQGRRGREQLQGRRQRSVLVVTGATGAVGEFHAAHLRRRQAPRRALDAASRHRQRGEASGS